MKLFFTGQGNYDPKMLTYIELGSKKKPQKTVKKHTKETCRDLGCMCRAAEAK